MKKIIIVTTCFVIVSCSKRTIPSANVERNETTVQPNSTIVQPNSNIINTDTAAIVATPNTSAAMLVVSDANGKMYVSQKNIPPEANVKFDYLQLSKGLTPQQKANLKTRYKTIPPRVLYVAPSYQLSSLKGSYYIYKKKFWYWKRKDGLFYLDEKYYL